MKRRMEENQVRNVDQIKQVEDEVGQQLEAELPQNLQDAQRTSENEKIFEDIQTNEEKIKEGEIQKDVMRDEKKTKEDQQIPSKTEKSSSQKASDKPLPTLPISSDKSLPNTPSLDKPLPTLPTLPPSVDKSLPNLPISSEKPNSDAPSIDKSNMPTSTEKAIPTPPLPTKPKTLTNQQQDTETSQPNSSSNSELTLIVGGIIGVLVLLILILPWAFLFGLVRNNPFFDYFLIFLPIVVWNFCNWRRSVRLVNSTHFSDTTNY